LILGRTALQRLRMVDPSRRATATGHRLNVRGYPDHGGTGGFHGTLNATLMQK